MPPAIEVVKLHVQDGPDDDDPSDWTPWRGLIAPCLRKLTLFGMHGERSDPRAVVGTLCAVPTRELELYTSGLAFTPELRKRLSDATRPFEKLQRFQVFHGCATLSTTDMFLLFSLMPHVTHLGIAEATAPPFTGNRAQPDIAEWYVSESDVGELPAPAFQLRSYALSYTFPGWHIPLLCSASTLRSLEVMSELIKPEELAALTAVGATLERLVFLAGTLPEQAIAALSACKRLHFLAIYIDNGFTASRLLALFDGFVLARCRLKHLALHPRDRNNTDAISAVLQYRLLDLSQALRALRTLSVLPDRRARASGHNAPAFRAFLQLLKRYCDTKKVRLSGYQVY